LLLAAVSCALGCSLDDRPSLGRYEPQPSPDGIPIMPAMPDQGMSGSLIGTGGTQLPPVHIVADGGQDPPTMHVPADAGRDAAPDARSIFDAAMNDAPGCTGVYAGDFMCMVDPIVANPPVASMSITMVLRESQTAYVANATAPLSFSYAGFMFAGDVAGALDCRTNEFHATVQNGLFAAELAPIPFPFQGQIDGELDQATRNLAGTWSFSSTDFGGSCTGTWSAALQP
jgi:hypothetical protein